MENSKQRYLIDSFNSLRFKGIVKTQKDFANLIGVDPTQLSKAMKGDEKNLTDKFIKKVENLMETDATAVPSDWVKDFPALDSVAVPAAEKERVEYLTVIPVEAMAGTLGDFAASVKAYDCERMISPIKGADYAMKVCGESMSPEYPNGCQILIKKVNENAFIEWGKVYVLDTENGAVIKKIRKTEREDEVECVSLNPEFQPFTVKTSFIRGWYRVLMVLSLK